MQGSGRLVLDADLARSSFSTTMNATLTWLWAGMIGPSTSQSPRLHVVLQLSRLSWPDGATMRRTARDHTWIKLCPIK